MGNSPVDFQFLWVLPSGRNIYATKVANVRVQFFFQSSSSCQLCKRIPVNYTSKYRKHFEATTYLSFFHACYLPVFKVVQSVETSFNNTSYVIALQPPERLQYVAPLQSTYGMKL
jgi:hypothetical protein